MHEILIALTLICGLLPSGLNLGQNDIINRCVDRNYDSKTEIRNTNENEDNLQINLPVTPTKEQNIAPTYSNSKAVLAIDLNSNKILFSKDKDTELPIASLTKLMTAFVILKENNLNDIITIPTLQNHPDDSIMGIAGGERLSVNNLLNGLLINSGSDAAQALAIQNSGSIDNFVSKMNNYAKELDLNHTHFSNPVGWDEEGNYSSANDVLSLTRILLNNTTFKDIVGNKSKTVYTEEGRAITLLNTNILLDGVNYLGVKTGYTLGAGECLVSLNRQSGEETLTVVIGSSNRFYETQTLKGWIYSTYLW